MESIGIYWIPIKVNMLPFIVQEVDKVIEKFFGGINRPFQAGDERKPRGLQALRAAESINQSKNRGLRHLLQEKLPRL